MKSLFLNPWAWLALIAGLLFSTGAGGVFGYNLSNQEAALREITATAKAGEQLAAATAEVSALEKLRIKDIGDIAIRHKQEMDDAKLKIDALRADVRSGAVRLSIATRPASDRAAGGNPAAAGDAVAESRAELSADAAEFLVGFAGSCDATARQLNAVIDAYEAIRMRTIDSKD